MKKSNKLKKGFTIVELLIVLAIIAVMSGVALPLYSKFVSKSQVGRVLGEISLYKRTIEDRLAQSNITNISTDPEGTLGFVDSNLSTVTFGSFVDAANSTISATMDGDTNGGIHNTTITLQRSSSGTWICTIVGAGGAWSDSIKPSECL